MNVGQPRFEAVLFDCDGVLVDSEAITNAVLREMLIELGWPISEADCVRLFIGRALAEQWPVILEHTGVRIDDSWIMEFRRRRDEGLRARVQPIAGVAAALAAIVAPDAYGSRVAVASGADMGKITMQLSVTGLSEYFGGRLFSGMDTPRSKPAPDVYLAAAAGLGVSAAESAVVEDTVAGVQAGVAAGATVFGYTSGSLTSTAPEALIEAGATAVFSDMAELPALLGLPTEAGA